MQCPKCGEYFLQKSNSAGTYCKKCRLLYLLQWQKNNKSAAANIALRNRCKKVGISLEHYHSLPKRCSFKHCKAVEPGGTGDWHLDHDHTTGKFRGFLCHKHNVGLGYFKNVEELQDAIEYLQRHYETSRVE